MTDIPNNLGQIRQINRGDIFGELHETFNIDLSSSPGKVLTSRNLTKVLDNATIGAPAGINQILIWDSEFYVITEDDTYSCSLSDDPLNPANWSEVVAITDNDVTTDAVIFDGQMRISRNTDIAGYDGAGSFASDWWTSDLSGTALNTGVPHQMAVVQSQKETIYVTDGSRVQYFEKGAASTQIVELDSNVTATCLAAGLSGAMWVGTYNSTNGRAYVYEIFTNEQVDGTPVYRQAYPIDARAVLAITVIDNVPHIITEKGVLMRFNNAGFSAIDELPFVFEPGILSGVEPGLIQNSGFLRPVHPNGMDTHADSLYILVNTREDDSDFAINSRSHSGVWEYNLSTGTFNHRWGLANSSDEFGAMKLESSGPLLVADLSSAFIFCGAEALNSAGSPFIFADQTSSSQSWFVTPQYKASSHQDSFNSIIHTARTMSDGEGIYTFYRTTERDTINASGTWLEANVINSTTDLSSVEEGDLLRVSHGNVSGEWATVSEIHVSEAVYSLVLDRNIGTVGQTSYFCIDNYQRLDDVMSSNDGEFLEIGVNDHNPWIQFLVVLKGDIEYRSLKLDRATKKV